MSYRKSSGVVPALLFVIVILVAVFYIEPLREAVASLKEEKEKKGTELETLNQQLKELKQFQAELPADSATITRKVPVDLKEDELILLVEKIAGNNNIAFSSLSFSPGSREPGKVTPVVISTSFEGNYKNLIAFLQELERSKDRKFFVRGVSVSLNSSKSEGEQPLPGGEGKYFDQPLLATFTLQLEAYYQGVLK